MLAQLSFAMADFITVKEAPVRAILSSHQHKSPRKVLIVAVDRGHHIPGALVTEERQHNSLARGGHAATIPGGLRRRLLHI